MPLEHRRRARTGAGFVAATSDLLGVSNRRVEKLAASLEVAGLPKPQVSMMAAGRRPEDLRPLASLQYRSAARIGLFKLRVDEKRCVGHGARLSAYEYRVVPRR